MMTKLIFLCTKMDIYTKTKEECRLWIKLFEEYGMTKKEIKELLK